MPFGREPGARLGICLRAAAATPQRVQAWQGVVADLGLDHAATLRYDDPRNGRGRRVKLAEDGTLQAFLFAGDTAAARWMLEWLQQQRPAAAWGRALLAAGAKPPQAGPARSVQVCACNDVDEDAIVQALRHCEGNAEDRLSGLQAQLRCGTSCGSCLPAVKALLRRQPAAVAAP